MSLYPEQAPKFSDTVKDLLSFLRNPQLPVSEFSGTEPEAELEEELEIANIAEEPASPAEPLRMFVHLLGLSLLLGLGVVMLLGTLQKAGLIPELPHAMEDAIKQLPFAVVFLLAAILMPALEEFAFRLWLIFRPQYFLVSLWLSAMFMHSTLVQAGGTYLGYGILAVAAGLTIWLLSFKQQAQNTMQALYLNSYRWVFYGATTLFALLHLMNFNPDLKILLLAPLLVLPQFLLGLILGYMRVRLGMIWAIALHSLYNALILTLAYTGMQADTATPASLLFFQ